jgi:hypothetical protein
MLMTARKILAESEYCRAEIQKKLPGFRALASYEFGEALRLLEEE